MVPVELRRTLAWLGAVLAFAVLPATVLGFRDTLAHVYPSCRYTLESVDEPLPLPQRSSLDDVLPLDQDHAGLLLHLDKDVDHHGSVVSARMIRVGTDADGRVCECGRVRRSSRAITSRSGRTMPGATRAFARCAPRAGSPRSARPPRSSPCSLATCADERETTERDEAWSTTAGRSIANRGHALEDLPRERVAHDGFGPVRADAKPVLPSRRIRECPRHVAADRTHGVATEAKRSGPTDLFVTPLAEAFGDRHATGPLVIDVEKTTPVRLLVEVLYRERVSAATLGCTASRERRKS